MQTPETLGTLALSIRRRLGDDPTEVPEDSRVWDQDEVERYIKDGVNLLCLLTHLLWEVEYLDNLPNTSNYRHEWERKYFKAPLSQRLLKDLPSSQTPSGTIRVFTTPSRPEVYFTDAGFTQQWEVNWMPGGHGPSNHTSRADRDGRLVNPYVAADVELPESLLQIDRVTWDDRKIDPTKSREIERNDTTYETIAGDVLAYMQDKDGLRRLRKWKRPSVVADYYTVKGLFGILRGAQDTTNAGSTIALIMHIDQFGSVFSGSLDAPPSAFMDFSPGSGALGASLFTSGAVTILQEFLNYTTIFPPPSQFSLGSQTILSGATGALRRLPGYFASYGPWGLARKLSKTIKNVRIEFFRRHKEMYWSNSEFELPEQYITYVRHYAMEKALSRRGPGQDLRLAKHYKSRWMRSVQRVLDRRNNIHSARLHRFGGTDEVLPQSKLAKLPRNIPDPGF